MKNKIILFAFLLCSFGFLQAQENPKNILLDIKLPSKMVIKGTSTLHDWESIVEETSAKLTVNDLNSVNVETLNVTVKVFSIKSGKKTMDKLTYKALKAKEYPTITFVFKEGKIIKETAEYVDIDLTGNLTVAGVTKMVTVKTQINKLGKTIALKGSHKLKMTDFGVDPPTALLGTIKTGDEITIEFNLTFE